MDDRELARPRLEEVSCIYNLEGFQVKLSTHKKKAQLAVAKLDRGIHHAKNIRSGKVKILKELVKRLWSSELETLFGDGDAGEDTVDNDVDRMKFYLDAMKVIHPNDDESQRIKKVEDMLKKVEADFERCQQYDEAYKEVQDTEPGYKEAKNAIEAFISKANVEAVENKDWLPGKPLVTPSSKNPFRKVAVSFHPFFLKFGEAFPGSHESSGDR